MKTIQLNGSPRTTAAETVATLAAELGFVKGTILIEHNGTALRPEEWPAVSLGEGDRLECLRIVAGG